MNNPYSFNRTRADLILLCDALNSLSLHSYQAATPIDAARGAELLASAINDTSRSLRPTDFNAVGLFVTEKTATQLASTLSTVNQLCPLKPFIEAQRMAVSVANLDEQKMQLPVDVAQSIEWKKMLDVRSIPVLKTAFNDSSKLLLFDEGVELVTDIDTAIDELKRLKSNRDTHIVKTDFVATSLPLQTITIKANNAQELANHIEYEYRGDNNMHWVFMFFVGSDSEIKLVKELFA